MIPIKPEKYTSKLKPGINFPIVHKSFYRIMVDRFSQKIQVTTSKFRSNDNIDQSFWEQNRWKLLWAISPLFREIHNSMVYEGIYIPTDAEARQNGWIWNDFPVLSCGITTVVYSSNAATLLPAVVCDTTLCAGARVIEHSSHSSTQTRRCFETS